MLTGGPVRRRHFEIKSLPIGQPMEKSVGARRKKRDKRVGPCKKRGQKKPKYSLADGNNTRFVEGRHWCGLGQKAPDPASRGAVTGTMRGSCPEVSSRKLIQGLVQKLCLEIGNFVWFC